MLLKEALALNEPLKELCGKRLTSFKTARLLSKALKKVEEEVEIYTKEQRKLLDVYVKKDEKGNFVISPEGGLVTKDPDGKQKYDEESKKLLETDIGEIPMIKMSETEFTSSADFPTPQAMRALESLISWDDNNESEKKN